MLPGAALAQRAPLLAGAALRPDGHIVAPLWEQQTDIARTQDLQALVGSGQPAQAPSPDEALAVFLAAMNGDHAALDLRASRMSATPEGFRTLAHRMTSFAVWLDHGAPGDDERSIA